MLHRQQGFTLIELLIVVAIMGIIAVIAIPLYTTYSIRTQVAEGIELASSAKAAATEYFQDRGVYAPDNNTAGVAAAVEIRGDYVTQVSLVPGGDIQVTYGNKVHPYVNGGVMTLTPVQNLGSLTWTCNGDAILLDKYLPPICR